MAAGEDEDEDDSRFEGFVREVPVGKRVLSSVVIIHGSEVAHKDPAFLHRRRYSVLPNNEP